MFVLGNYPDSLFGDVCVRKSKTLTLIRNVFLVGLSQFCGLVLSLLCFG